MIRQLRYFLGTLRQLWLTKSSSSAGRWSSWLRWAGLKDTGRSSVLPGTRSGATRLGAGICFIFCCGRGKRFTASRRMSCAPLWLQSPQRWVWDSICQIEIPHCCWGWVHRTEFNQVHFLMRNLGPGIDFKFSRKKNKVIEVWVS